jgi:hypothetical protein
MASKQGVTEVTESTSSNEASKPEPAVSGYPNIWDTFFLIFLAGVLVCVAWVGVLSHEEGYKNEVTKQNAEAWAKWLKENSEPRLKEDFALENCAASAMERKRWGECFGSIMENVKELNGLRNAFTGEPLTFIAKCDPKDSSTNGNMVLEKIVPTPPGSAIPTVASQMLDIDAIDTKTSLKLTVCDKGGYAIKVDEFEF